MVKIDWGTCAACGEGGHTLTYWGTVLVNSLCIPCYLRGA